MLKEDLVVQKVAELAGAMGEKIGKDSPVIRDLFAPDRFGTGFVDRPTRLAPGGVRRLIEDALFATGVRKKVNKRRYEFQAVHGFRKYFNTAWKDAGLNFEYAEILLNHTLSGLDDSYLRSEDNKILEEYLKAVPRLTLSEEDRAKFKLAQDYEEKEKNVDSNIVTLSMQIQALTKRINEQDKIMQYLVETLNLRDGKIHKLKIEAKD